MAATEGDIILHGEIIDLAASEDNSARAAPPPNEVINADAPEEPAVVEKNAALQKKEAYEERKKRRRMMREMLRPGGRAPSFVALVTPHLEEEAPKRIRIDVDSYLGLKKKEPEPEAVPSSVASANNSSSAVLAPSDEGWFEGCIPLSLPGEERFLPELQLLIRSNLEIFSATEADVSAPQPGRRTKTIRGKVGVRCRHCAEAIRENPALPWPPGSVSYPLNIVGLYPCCSQKPQLHFQTCPHMSEDDKAQLHRLMFDEEGAPRVRQRKAIMPSGTEKSMSTVLYYTIAAKMIGIVDVSGGMRFGRDLALEPLPMETIRAQIEDVQVPYARNAGSSKAKPTPVLSSTPRITADVDSERVLAQTVAEKDNDLLLAKSDDKALVTDWLFLCIKQMAICNATHADFATRGKKTKLMKIGFAGFCCRHCAHFKPDEGVVHYVDYSCRSFSSAADNLASAISNSFYIHVSKCPATPQPIRSALAAYKRIHSRQMGQLQYGSQRRMFGILWSRLRAMDLSEEQMEEKMKSMPPPPEPVLSAVAAAAGPFEDSSTDTAMPDAVPSESLANDGRSGHMPVCDDEETKAVLKRTEENWDPTVNDSLIVPADRNLVTDFVFLMMRQLRAAWPTEIDFSRGRRNTVADTSQPGLKCMHCMNHNQIHLFKSAVGRSFPSAPDNMASTMNSSMFQHLQKCPFTPVDVKRALANLKKIHSAQCASLRFGSQRRFFNTVFDRLKDAPNSEPTIPVPVENGESVSVATPAPSSPSPAAAEADDTMLAQCGFVETANGCFECQFCRMVPFALRALSSTSIGRPSGDSVQDHFKVCRKDSLDLSSAAQALKAASEKYFALDGRAILASPSFVNVIEAALGDNKELSKVLIKGLAKAMMEDQDTGNGDDNQGGPEGLSGLWNKFPLSVDSEKVILAFKDFAECVSGLDTDLYVETQFLRFLRVLSPSFVITARATPANDAS